MRAHKGKVIKLGDNIDTDIIIPTQYMTLKTIEKMIPYSFSPMKPDFSATVNAGDIFVCGKNFGSGSSREQAAEIIKKMRVYCVIAKSFSRLFYRNAINNGLLVIENSQVFDNVEDGDLISVDTDSCHILLEDDMKISFGKLPKIIHDIIEHGGLVPYWKAINTK